MAQLKCEICGWEGDKADEDYLFMGNERVGKVISCPECDTWFDLIEEKGRATHGSQ